MALLSRFSDLLLYGGAVSLMIALAVSLHEGADAPAAPPPVSGDSAITASASLGAGQVRRLPQGALEQASGTAFSVSEAGVWITARHVVGGCRRAAVLVSPGRGVEARVIADRTSDVAVLLTKGGAPPLPLAPHYPLHRGQIAFHPGYPRGQAGEAASRFLGPFWLPSAFRGAPAEAVQAWAEVGRTDGLKGSLAGLSGAPVLDGAGQVVGVTLAESPRRGRIYSAPRRAIRAALADAGQKPAAFAAGQPITTDNYGRAADGLRRDLSVAEVVCLD
jgi:S1-C subfamily serine protease